MMVKHEIETMLHNLEIEKQKNDKTIEFIQSCFNDQIKKREELWKEMNMTKELLKILNSEENTPS